ncbi:protease complex subunit PrcB family protein [Laceyella putida]|uniref:Protease complex subunit PrcB family protein n=1 Tax=Laceyella putida TaxID=110101 RepID=A0ABW2RKT1_9BACL
MNKEESLSFKQVEPNQIPQTVRRETDQWTSPQATAKFVSDTYIIVGIGERPTGGYEVRVTSVTKQGPRLIVHAKVIPPKEGMMVTQVISYPYAVIQLKEKAPVNQVEVKISNS